MLIKKLVMVDRRWVPAAKGYSLYVRPMIVGTRHSEPTHARFAHRPNTTTCTLPPHLKRWDSHLQTVHSCG